MYYPNYTTSPLQSASANARILLEGFHTVFYDELKETPDTYSKIFNIEKSDKRSEVVFSMGGLTMATLANDGGPTEFEDIFNGGSKEVRHLEYRKGYRVTAATLEDALYGITKKAMKQLPRVFPRRVESYCAGLVGGSFTTTYCLEDDNSATTAVCSDSHDYASGKSDMVFGTTTAQSNVLAVASAPTPATLQTAVTQFRKIRGRVGEPLEQEPNTVLAPIDLEPVFWKVFNSVNQAFEFSNTKGIFGPSGPWNMKVQTWKWPPSTTAWWIMDSESSPFTLFWRVKPEFKNDYDMNNHVHRYFGRMRLSGAAFDWRGILGTTG
jgi:phage major head subunit gpT-like protein